MKKISFWSRDHVWTTRLIIVFLIYPLLNLTGWIFGDLLQSMEIMINPGLAYPLCALVLIAFALYPAKGNGRHHNYSFRKTLDCILVTATFCFIVLSGNHIESSTHINITGASYAATVTSEVKTSHPEIKKKKKKSLMKMLRDLRKKYREADDGTKAVLIVLAVLAFLVLAFLLGALSCNIACSGAEGAAYIVFFLGLGGLIWGLVAVIKRISKGPKKKPAETKEPGNT